LRDAFAVHGSIDRNKPFVRDDLMTGRRKEVVDEQFGHPLGFGLW
jgi:hypothetical protein